MPWSATTLGFDFPKVVCYVPSKIDHVSWRLFWRTRPAGGCFVRRKTLDLTIEPSAGSFMTMGGFSVM